MAPRDFRAGAWHVRPESNELVSASATVRLEPRAMDVLALLAEHAGEVVSHDDLLARVWPGTFVAESGIFRVVSDLRRALGDTARAAQYIQTIPKRGYRLVAPVTWADEPAPSSGARARRSPGLVFAVLQVAVMLAIGFGLMWRARTPAPPPRPSDTPEARVDRKTGEVWEARADCAAYARARASYEQSLAEGGRNAATVGSLADSYLASAVLGCVPAERASASLAALLPRTAPWTHESRFARLRAAELLWFGGTAADAGASFAADRTNEPDVNRAAYLLATGQPEAGVLEARRAWDLDPAAVGENWTLATALLFAHRFADAADQYAHTLDLYPEFPPARSLRVLALWLADRPDDARRAALEAERRLSTPFDRFSSVPGFVLAKLGDAVDARRFLDRWTALARASTWVAPTAWAVTDLAQGAPADAARRLREAAAMHDPWMTLAALDPILSGVSLEAGRPGEQGPATRAR